MGLTFKLGTAAQVTTNYIPKANSNSFSNSLIFDNGTNVGIGTSTPESITTYRVLQLTGAGTSTGGIFTTTTSDGSLKGRFLTSLGEVSIGAVTNSPFVMFTNDTERMKIAAAGEVLINTSTKPSGIGGSENVKLFVKQATSGNYGIAAIANTNDSFTYIGHTGTVATVGTSYGTTGSYTDLTFRVSDVERVRLTSVGEILYGTSTTPYNGALFRATYGTNNYFSFGPRNNDNAWVVWNNSGTGVYINNGNTSWTGVSDERLKDIKYNIENACDIVKNWRTVVFSWKEQDETNLNVGLIAQDVQNTLPEVIDTNKLKGDDIEYLGIRYSEVIPVLVKCIQELEAKIVTLESKIN